MANYMSQAMKTPEKIVKQIIICQKCGSKNPNENKFCGQCGQALYPPPPIQCATCGNAMSSSVNYCMRCGSLLRKQKRIRKKKD